MASCIHCNATIPDGSRFCNFCGAKQELTCPACQTVLPEGSRFCHLCGASVSGGAPAAEPAPVAAPVAAPAAEKAPAAPAAAFSAEWERYQNHGDQWNTRWVGGSKYHFKLESNSIAAPMEPVEREDGSISFQQGPSRFEHRLTRIHADGTGILIKKLPLSDEEQNGLACLAWADDTLWLSIHRTKQNTVCIYEIHQDTLVFKPAAEISVPDGEVLRFYVTPDAWYFGMYHRNLYLGEDHYLRADRKTGAVKELLEGPSFRGSLSAVSSQMVWVDGSFHEKTTMTKTLSLLVDAEGNATPLHEHPDFAPLLPLMAELTHYPLPLDNDIVPYLRKHILYIDFTERQVYVCQDSGEPDKGAVYALPFGADDAAQAVEVWKRSAHLLDTADAFVRTKQFNGRYCLGVSRQFEAEYIPEGSRKKHGEIFKKATVTVQTADGRSIELGDFWEDGPAAQKLSFTLVRDMVYAFHYSGLKGRYLLSPGAEQAEYQEVHID